MTSLDGLKVDPRKYDYLYTAILVGDSGVGKSAILSRFAENEFHEDFSFPTIGLDFQLCCLRRGNKRVLLQVWDTSGNGRYRSLIRHFYMRAMGAIIVCDLTSQKSIAGIGGWLQEIRKFAFSNTQIIMVGNKCDRMEDRIVSCEDVVLYAQQLGIPYIETSAKENYQIRKTFELITDKIWREMRKSFETKGLDR